MTSQVLLFPTLEVVLFLTLVSLHVLSYLGLSGLFFKQKIIESHVGTSVVLFLALENVGVFV